MPGINLAETHRRYLRLLGIDGAPSGLDGLATIVERHIRRVPFENVSKLLLMRREGRGRVTTIEEFLDGIDHHDLGGTCYTSNPFLADLLGALGYDASLVGADMSQPNVHTSVRVRIGGRRYHVDVGYAAPFREPIPLDGPPSRIAWGADSYVCEPAGETLSVTMFTNGERRHGYVAHPPRRPAEFFHPVILDSFVRGRTFLQCLRITRFFDDHAFELRNRRLLTVTARGTAERRLDSLDELREVVAEQFLMPRCRIEDAVAELERLNGRAFFGPEPWKDSTD